MSQGESEARDNSIERFCHQYLQLERDLDYPPADQLREADTQDILYHRLFADGAISYPPPQRYQLKVLKELTSRIEASIEDWDRHGVSDDLMNSLSSLLALPLLPELTAAQQKSYVTYTPSLITTSQNSSTPSPQITLLESRNLISAAGTTGLRTWEAALHLGQYLSANPSYIKGQEVLELGAGTGYLSILCAKYLGAKSVVASDGSDEVVATLPDNFFLNGLQDDENIRAMDVKWGHALVGTEEEEWNGGRPFDIVIGADITYDKSVIPALMGTLGELIGMFNTTVLIAATERNQETFEAFIAACEKMYLNPEIIDFELPRGQDQQGPFYSDKVPIKICRIFGAGVHFTTDIWVIEQEKAFILTWTDAIGPVDIDLVNLSSYDFTRNKEIVKGYTGNNTFEWAPDVDLSLDDYALYIDDGRSVNISPTLSSMGPSVQSIQSITSRDVGDSIGDSSPYVDNGLSSHTVVGISVGCTVGGVSLLGVISALVRGRQQDKKTPGDEEAKGQVTEEQEQKQPEPVVRGDLTLEDHMDAITAS
ncbi:putative methyltransferase-domain-containing protein [Hypoxylon trugodes]|uniref:putative methyltransferase-domain-containing protein n=1 Tax=Hypoxylon trugodes TaxID=326681 RepID=UPI002198412C|nr:putative methyltransferase-domain-containing protein [Hypoxylon trugodes]KAI1394446.1 putative methyltransferase-domain-containing protein [Hypoxylon trugodes]